MRRKFVFNQVEVARKMAATPKNVNEGARQKLFDLVNQSRASGQRTR